MKCTKLMGIMWAIGGVLISSSCASNLSHRITDEQLKGATSEQLAESHETQKTIVAEIGTRDELRAELTELERELKFLTLLIDRAEVNVEIADMHTQWGDRAPTKYETMHPRDARQKITRLKAERALTVARIHFKENQIAERDAIIAEWRAKLERARLEAYFALHNTPEVEQEKKRADFDAQIRQASLEVANAHKATTRAQGKVEAAKGALLALPSPAAPKEPSKDADNKAVAETSDKKEK